MTTAKQPHPFDPRKAASLEDPQREQWFPSDALLRHLAIVPPMRILDYGAGTARYALLVAAAYPAAEVQAFDSQQEMLDLARRRVLEANVRNVLVCGPELPSAAGRFDRVLALNVLHEVEDDDLQQMRRILAPDGFVLFVDWNAAIARDFGPPADHVYTIAEARERLERLGFQARLIPDAAFPYHYIFLGSVRP
jgi:ubiquinone/menaquinone biosynthesis C-methylase UbiE